jgi:hypothetical protein
MAPGAARRDRLLRRVAVDAALYKVVSSTRSSTRALGDLRRRRLGSRLDLICYVAVPTAIVWLAMNSEIDGRAPHRWAFSCLRFLVKDKHTFCGQRVRRDGEHVRYRGGSGSGGTSTRRACTTAGSSPVGSTPARVCTSPTPCATATRP